MGKPQQPQPKPTRHYQVRCRFIYIHTYEPAPYDEDDVDDIPEPCPDPDCPCDHRVYDPVLSRASSSGDGTDNAEPPLTASELDAFMCEALYNDKPRYYYFLLTTMEYYSILNATYEGDGYVSFRIAGNLRPTKIRRKLLNSRNIMYDAGPGSESKVPTVHRYSYTPLMTLETDYTYNERGRIEVSDEEDIRIELVAGS